MQSMLKRVSKSIVSFILIAAALIAACVFMPMQSEANDIGLNVRYLTDVYGQINTHGGGVYGYTTDYMRGGSQEVEHKVENGWHIQAVMSYDVYGITWYCCYDSDDGDYYGWIDGKYIDFYSSTPATAPQPSVNAYSVNSRRGEVDGSGVYGYTSNYVLYGGSQETQHKVQDGWHITAYSTAYSHGVTWYECWDSDDGDYYGWIDARYIAFYDEMTQPVVTSIVTQTVLVTEAPKPVETVIIEKTVVVTEYVTEATVTTTTTQEAFEAMAVDDDDDYDNTQKSGIVLNGTFIIILIAVAVLLLIAVAVILIIIFTRKTKSSATVQYVQPGYPEETAEFYEPFYCKNCGAERKNPDAVFCAECGRPYDDQNQQYQQ